MRQYRTQKQRSPLGAAQEGGGGGMKTSRSPWDEGFAAEDTSGRRMSSYDDQLMDVSTGQKGPTNSVMLQYYSKQELLRNEPSLT